MACLASFLVGCSAKYLKYEKAEELKKIDDFDKRVTIVMPEDATGTPTPAPAVTPDPSPTSVTTTAGSLAVPVLAPTPTATKPVTKESAKEKRDRINKEKKEKLAKVREKAKGAKPKGRRQPELESDVGFDGRRPIIDPFRVGEKVVHRVHYYSISAGTLTLEVKPFATVNERKTYNFRMAIKTSEWYSGIYSVDDYGTILMDYENLIPTVLTLHIRETGQLREARMLMEPRETTFWERKVTEKHGEEERRLTWETPEYTQNLFSGIYYMRTFHWDVGTENAFRVTDDKENLIFRGKAIRKEKLTTAIGEFNAIVIKPQVELKGKYKPVGDIFVWLSDDERKYILRIESKIKIGTLTSEIIELNPGRPSN